MFRDIAPADLDDLLTLNNAHAIETSLLDRSRLERMVSIAFFARTIESKLALLTTFDQSSDYDSVNFRWFRARYPRFIYIDRIIVAASERGKGIARALYADLFAEARVHGHDVIAAEVNSLPPNPGSDAFHASLGFAVVDRGSPYPGKEVSYLIKALHHP
jgi:uncharacterized protein